MIEFMVLSAPRSGSTWAATWLTGDRSLCLHDPTLEMRPEELEKLECDRRLGIADTALVLIPEFVNANPCPKVILHRPIAEVNASLERIGLTKVPDHTKDLLTKVNGMHLPWTSLFNPTTADAIHRHLLGRPMDRRRHDELVRTQINPRFDRLPINIDIVHEFRRRIEMGLRA